MVDPPPAGDRLPPLPALDERYAIRGVLGTGGKATVYLADDRLLTRRVAIKVFRARAETPEALREQETEAKVIASLQHHALTTLFDAGVDASDPARPQIYLVMEHIEGGDLKRRLQRGALTWFQACWLGRDLCEGLHYLHGSGFLHRDIKPANVLLAESGDERARPKLADFGIASLVGSRSPSDEVTGTAAYLSPEQVEGESPTEASDVYALGLVLLEAVTARTAFPGGIEESAFARLHRDPVIPDALPRRVRQVLAAMTARRPQDRPPLLEAAAVFQNLLIDDLVRQRGFGPVSPEQDDAAPAAVAARYDILDSPSEESFDRITRLAARLLQVPICVISITDQDRVWLKSRRGLDESEFSRNTAFCAHPDPGGGAWTIPDTLADDRTAGSPLVTAAPHIRAFAAAPLITHDGHVLGSLCACDVRPRAFDEDALLTLTELAGVVMHEIDLRLASRRALFDR